MVGCGMSKVDHKYSFPECARKKKHESKEAKKGHVVVNGGNRGRVREPVEASSSSL